MLDIIPVMSVGYEGMPPPFFPILAVCVPVDQPNSKFISFTDLLKEPAFGFTNFLYCLCISYFICTYSHPCSSIYFFAVEFLLPKSLEGSAPPSLGPWGGAGLPFALVLTLDQAFSGEGSWVPFLLHWWGRGQPDVESRVPSPRLRLPEQGVPVSPGSALI